MIARTLDLETLTLAYGGHDADDGQMCVMEAVAWLAGEDWTDAPLCASPVIAAFCRNWNDAPDPYGQAIRDRLKTYIPRLIGTRAAASVEDRRAYMALDWLVRVHAPAWLRLAGLTEHADALASLPPQLSLEALASSAAAWDAASAAAWDAAWAAARDAARDAARAAAWDAASAAAWVAAWDVLAPTVESLQASAWELLDRMIDAA